MKRMVVRNVIECCTDKLLHIFFSHKFPSEMLLTYNNCGVLYNHVVPEKWLPLVLYRLAV